MDASIDERAPVDLTSDTNLTSDTIRTPTLAVRELAYFGSEVRDASTVKRVQQFIDHGFAVTVFGFHRTRYNNDYQPPWPHVTMGTTIDGRYSHRLLALLHGLIGLDLLRLRETVPLLLVHVAGNIYGSRTKREGAGADRDDEEERHV